VLEGRVCALGLYILSMNDNPSIFFRNICVQCVTIAVRRVEWCVAGSVSLEVTSGSVSDGRKVVRVRIGYVSVQLRWIVKSQELGSVGTRIIAVGFLDPPFWLHTQQRFSLKFIVKTTQHLCVPLFLDLNGRMKKLPNHKDET